jgi:Ca-activated chloride channel family protein
MKKIVWLSGVAAALLLPLLLTGWADQKDTVHKAFRAGNEQYASDQYGEALKFYEQGLEADPEHTALNFNAAQAAYQMGDYEKAVRYYERADASVEKYLNAGNSLVKTGDAVVEQSEKQQYYSQALEVYKEGIIKYPQDVHLKFNYELIKQKLDQLSEEMEEENESSQPDQQSDDQDDKQDDNQDHQDSQTSDDNEQQNTQEDSGNQNQDQSSQPEEGFQDEQDWEAVARILEMLAGEEEESLKNNQGVVVGRDDAYGW